MFSSPYHTFMLYSLRQRQAAGIALAAKRGKTPVIKLKGASLSMFKTMSIKQFEDFASGPIKKLKIAGR